jgi:3-hydroxyisobutyrate dehydrogenase-like beta-hydroxyacid dehydrogenase
MPIGVVGLGELGTIVVRGLREAGHAVLGYDRMPSNVVAATPLVEIARTCDLVLVAVATDAQVREVATELFTAMQSGTLVLHSTVTPRTPRELAALAPDDVLVVDAPVSIHRDAESRPCVAYVGSDSPVPPEVSRVLVSYCREAIPVGGLGAGQLVKLANNVMSLVNTAVAAEALRLAAAAGADPDLVRRLALKGSGASHALATWPNRAELFDEGAPSPRKRALAAKDLTAALTVAVDLGVDLPLTRRAQELLAAMAYL